jgi:hypothetical protein
MSWQNIGLCYTRIAGQSKQRKSKQKHHVVILFCICSPNVEKNSTVHLLQKARESKQNGKPLTGRTNMSSMKGPG